MRSRTRLLRKCASLQRSNNNYTITIINGIDFNEIDAIYYIPTDKPLFLRDFTKNITLALLLCTQQQQ